MSSSKKVTWKGTLRDSFYLSEAPSPPIFFVLELSSNFVGSDSGQIHTVQCKTPYAIYAPMIHLAPCIMFWMRAYTLRGQVRGGRALEIETFLGPLKWHRADINHRCIGGFMYKSPRGRFQGPYCGGQGSRCIKELNCSARAAQVHKGT